MKVTILGCGHVGSTLGYAIINAGLVDELVLLNRTRQRAEGEAADLRHAAALVQRPVQIRAGTVSDSRDSDVIAVTASVPTPSDLQSRNELVLGNAELMRQWIPPLASESPHAVFVMITNPVEAISYIAWKHSGLPSRQFIGTGTLIDTMRWRSMLSAHLGIHSDDVRAYILGEHGDTQFPALSVSATGGKKIDTDPMIAQLFEQARTAGLDVYRQKGYTNYAISQAALLMIETVLRDSRRTLPVSTLVDGYCGIHDVFLSIPAVVGRAGVLRLLKHELSADEQEKLHVCAETIRAVIDSVENA
ncbi:MAG: lactate dehydrogenase [Planctomycetota bacterium]